MTPVGTSPRTSEVRVLVVDDNAGFRESLVSLLDTGELHVVGQAADGAEALALMMSVEPDVVLMDVRMPSMDGVEATRRLKAMRPDIGVVALTGNEDQRAVRDMLVAGASGYVLKDSDGDEILHAVRQAAAGGGVISPEVTPTVIEELTEALERERRRTRQLEIAQEALLERAARRHELVSRLGHELRTPVTVILGMASTLSKGTAPIEQRAEILDTLVDRAESLSRLVQRFEAAVEAGLTEWADVTQVAREVAEVFPRVVVDAAPGPAMATLNRTAARRILEELVENALAFSPSDTPVTINVRVNGHGPRGARRGSRQRRVAGSLRADLRPARAGRGPEHPPPPGRRAGPHAGSDVGARDGRRRLPGSHGARGIDVPVAGHGRHPARLSGSAT